MDKSKDTFANRADRFGGKLIYRTVSIIPLVLGLFSAKGAWDSAMGFHLVSTVILAGISLLCLWAVKWCWSSKRSFGEFLDANS